jgi:hypothetical protein
VEGDEVISVRKHRIAEAFEPRLQRARIGLQGFDEHDRTILADASRRAFDHLQLHALDVDFQDIETRKAE